MKDTYRTKEDGQARDYSPPKSTRPSATSMPILTLITGAILLSAGSIFLSTQKLKRIENELVVYDSKYDQLRSEHKQLRADFQNLQGKLPLMETGRETFSSDWGLLQSARRDQNLFILPVRFHSRFTRPPLVFIERTSNNTRSNQERSAIHSYIDNVTSNGFDILIMSDADANLDGVGISWLAHQPRGEIHDEEVTKDTSEPITPDGSAQAL
ncbi:MAG: hypothetical protein GY856_48520 [bacterium]|nr:hypothetical protein [bacterium]